MCICVKAWQWLYHPRPENRCFCVEPKYFEFELHKSYFPCAPVSNQCVKKCKCFLRRQCFPVNGCMSQPVFKNTGGKARLRTLSFHTVYQYKMLYHDTDISVLCCMSGHSHYFLTINPDTEFCLFFESFGYCCDQQKGDLIIHSF